MKKLLTLSVLSASLFISACEDTYVVPKAQILYYQQEFSPQKKRDLSSLFAEISSFRLSPSMKNCALDPKTSKLSLPLNEAIELITYISEEVEKGQLSKFLDAGYLTQEEYKQANSILEDLEQKAERLTNLISNGYRQIKTLESLVQNYKTVIFRMNKNYSTMRQILDLLRSAETDTDEKIFKNYNKLKQDSLNYRQAYRVTEDIFEKKTNRDCPSAALMQIQGQESLKSFKQTLEINFADANLEDLF